MIRFVLLLALTVASPTAMAAAPDDYAWRWPLLTEGDAAAWRIRLEPYIVRRLADPEARDLAVFDANGKSMPLLRIPAARLVETTTSSHELRFEARAHGDAAVSPGAGVSDESDRLTFFLLRPDGTRVELRAPDGEPTGRDSPVVYEALIEGRPGAGSEQSSKPASHWLVTEWRAEQPVQDSLKCTVTPVAAPQGRDLSGVSGTALVFRTAYPSRPATMTTRSRVATDARGWHVSCRAPALPSGLALVRAALETSRSVDHASQVGIPLEGSHPEPGVMQGRVEHPFASSRLRISSAAPNQLAKVRLLIRDDPEAPWRQYAEAEFSNLRADAELTAGQAVFDLSGLSWRMFDWRIESTPPLVAPVHAVLEARVEEWLFLAQGQPPWSLHAGSRRAPPSDPDPWTEATLARVAPAWELPRARPGPPSEAGGETALKPPPAPLPWSRWLLWLILIGGSLAVAWLAARLLQSPA